MSKSKKKSLFSKVFKPEPIRPQKKTQTVKANHLGGVFYIQDGEKKLIDLKRITGDANNMENNIKEVASVVTKAFGRKKCEELLTTIKEEVAQEFGESTSDEFWAEAYKRFECEIREAYSYITK